ncbi:hypothetical protein B0H11DRAFT_2229632 [Mycena galericulata]|nr:hypothetical protein B0H11DRAFT_2229632 [Mycena galericulata]
MLLPRTSAFDASLLSSALVRSPARTPRVGGAVYVSPRAKAHYSDEASVGAGRRVRVSVVHFAARTRSTLARAVRSEPECCTRTGRTAPAYARGILGGARFTDHAAFVHAGRTDGTLHLAPARKPGFTPVPYLRAGRSSGATCVLPGALFPEDAAPAPLFAHALDMRG